MKEHATSFLLCGIIAMLIVSNFLTVYFFLSGMWSSNIAIEQALRAVVTVEEAVQTKGGKKR